LGSFTIYPWGVFCQEGEEKQVRKIKCKGYSVSLADVIVFHPDGTAAQQALRTKRLR